jgi:hypothetical protein
VGGGGTVRVTTTSECKWTASSNAAWLTIVGAASGSGTANIAWLAAPSLETTPRTGAITIEGQTFTVTQQPLIPTCSYAISPESANVGPAATTLTVSVTTQAGCTWTVKQEDPWLQIDSANSGTGNGTVKIGVERYKGNGQRTGTVTIAGKTLTVTQRKSTDNQ